MSLRLNSVPKNATQRTLEHVLAVGALFGRPKSKTNDKWSKWSQKLKANPDEISNILKEVEQEKMMEFILFLVNADHGAKTVFAAWDSMPKKYIDDKSLAFGLLSLAGNPVTDKDRVRKIAESFSDQLKEDIKVMASAIMYNVDAIYLVPESLKSNVDFAMELIIFYHHKKPTEMPWIWFEQSVLDNQAFKQKLDETRVALKAYGSGPGTR